MPKPKPTPKPEILWYSKDWREPTFDAAKLAAGGVTGVMALAVPWHFGPQNQALSLADLRTNAAEIKSRTGSLAVWWTFMTVRQGPHPGDLPRTLVNPKDAALRTMLLDNYASIGRVAREFGFAGLALDVESMTAGNIWPDEKGARDLGGDLARACRRDNPALRLMAFGPLGDPPAGFRKVWRGVADGAKATGEGLIFWTEDSYDLARVPDVKHALAHVQDLTHCATPALGWWPLGHVPHGQEAAYVQQAAAKAQEAARRSGFLPLYREGEMSAAGWDALSGALRGVN